MHIWSPLTKFLHIGMVVTIVTQLVISLVMEIPAPPPAQAQGIGATFFEIHEIVGLVAAVFILLHWLWLFKAPDNSFADFFPWNSSGRK